MIAEGEIKTWGGVDPLIPVRGYRLGAGARLVRARFEGGATQSGAVKLCPCGNPLAHARGYGEPGL